MLKYKGKIRLSFFIFIAPKSAGLTENVPD